MHPPAPDHEQHPRGIKAALARFVWRITPTCHEVTRLTSEGRDRPLPLVTRLRLDLHRSFCLLCARYAGQLDVMHEGIGDVRDHLDEPVDARLSDVRKAELKRALRGDAAR